MASALSTTLQRVLTLLTGLLILKVTGAVMLGYVNYFPPNFDADFLRGRERYFFGGVAGAGASSRCPGVCSWSLFPWLRPKRLQPRPHTSTDSAA